MRALPVLAGFLAVALASAAARADDGWSLPGYQAGGLVLKPSLTGTLAFLPQANAWFGRSSANVGGHVDHWWEGFLEPRLDASYATGGAGTVYGALSIIGSFTSGLDGAGSNLGNDNPHKAAWEDAYVGWRSGKLLGDSLGEDALDVSFGRQSFEVGSGFLISDGNTTDGGRYGALYLGPRTAFQETAIGILRTGPLTSQAFYLKPESDPSTGTRLAGVDLGLALKDGACAPDSDVPGCLAAGYYRVLDDDDPTRDGMNVLDLRADFHPIPKLDGLRLAGELAYERNGSKLDAYGWYSEVGYNAAIAWTPYLAYRYAFFSGDDPGSGHKSEAFDPLYYSGGDYGTWTQGLVLGNYVLTNSNLVSHMVRLKAEPTDALTLNLLYFHFFLDNPQSEGAGVTSHDFAQEADLISDYAVNSNLTLSLAGSLVLPESGAKQLTGGNDPWVQLVLSALLTF